MATASEVVELVKNDADLRQKLGSASDADSARQVLSSAGVTFSDSEFDAFKVKYDSGEVDEADLERIAGGGAGTWVSTTGTVVGAAASAAAAFA